MATNLSSTVAAQRAAANANQRFLQQVASQNAAVQAQAAAAQARENAGIPTPGNILSGQAQSVQGLSYTPIDIEALKKSATEQAAQNAAQSIALEQKLSPGVASARTGLQKQVSDELALGGNLPPDVAARVGRLSAGQAGSAGILGSQAPATAAALGLTSLDLANSRRANAANLLASNPLPVAGLDPGALAGLSVANTNAANQFALSKLGAQTNLANTQLGFIGSQQAQDQAAQNARIAAQNANNVPSPGISFGGAPSSYVPLSTYGGGGQSNQILDFNGQPINPNAPSLYSQYPNTAAILAAQRAKQQAAVNYAANPNTYGPGY